MKKYLSLFLAIMLIAALLPTFATADEPDLNAEYVWNEYSGKIYTSGDMTVKADTADGQKVFVFEGLMDTTITCACGELDSYFNEYSNSYIVFFEAEDDYYEMDFYLNDSGEIYAVQVFGIDFELNEEYYSYDGTYTDPSIAPNGTQFYPWNVSASTEDNVTAYYMYDSLYVGGTGNMCDFASLADRPWNDLAPTIDSIFFDDGVTGIGSLAFAGFGSGLVDDGFTYVGVYMPETIETIGDSAFAGARLGDDMFFYENVRSIGSRAFADTGLETVIFFCDAPSIAADAFSGVTAAAYALFGSSWTNEQMLDYGGSLTWKPVYRVYVDVDYGTEDMSGSSTIHILDGELFEYDADYDCSDDCEFVSWELVAGTLDIGDGTSPYISGYLCDNVQLVLHLNYIGEIGDDDDDFDDDDDADDDDDDAPGKRQDVVKDDEHTERTISDGPRTGDTSHKTLWIVVAAVAVAAFVVTGVLSKKSKAATTEAPVETEENSEAKSEENK